MNVAVWMLRRAGWWIQCRLWARCPSPSAWSLHECPICHTRYWR